MKISDTLCLLIVCFILFNGQERPGYGTTATTTKNVVNLEDINNFITTFLNSGSTIIPKSLEDALETIQNAINENNIEKIIVEFKSVINELNDFAADPSAILLKPLIKLIIRTIQSFVSQFRRRASSFGATTSSVGNINRMNKDTTVLHRASVRIADARTSTVGRVLTPGIKQSTVTDDMQGNERKKNVGSKIQMGNGAATSFLCTSFSNVLTISMVVISLANLPEEFLMRL